MQTRWNVSFEIDVTDPEALLYGARKQAKIEGVEDTRWLGTTRDPDVGACLRMLLDRNELLEGAEIEASSAEEMRWED